jgi:hypothetical protein
MSAATSTRQSVSGTAQSFLDQISTKAVSKPTAAVVFGPPGIGKTEFGAAFPGCVFLPTEDGVNTLKTYGRIGAEIPVLPQPDTWDDVLAILREFQSSAHKYKALIVDTFGGIETLCHKHVCNQHYNGDWGEKGFQGYQRGYETSLPEWRLFLNELDNVRTKGMSVVLLGHSEIKPFKSPVTEDYDRYVPAVHHKTWKLTHRWADMVIFYNYHIVIDDSGNRAKGKGGNSRILNTEFCAAFEAKNRHGLPAEIDAGDSGEEAYKNLIEAIKESKGAN